MTNIKWKDIYYPIGAWYSKDGTEVVVNSGKNFPFEFNGTLGVCVMVNGHCGHGHGEPAIDAPVPMFLNAETYEVMKIDGFISVDSSIVSAVQNEKVTHKVGVIGSEVDVIKLEAKRILDNEFDVVFRNALKRLMQ